MGKNIPNDNNICTYPKWSQNLPNGLKTYPNGRKINIPTSSVTYPPKFTQIGIFGLKINHLDTLLIVAYENYCSKCCASSKSEQIRHISNLVVRQISLSHKIRTIFFVSTYICGTTVRDQTTRD
jgi:hypothetical protein